MYMRDKKYYRKRDAGIYKLYYETDMTAREIGDEYGLGESTIRRIVKNVKDRLADPTQTQMDLTSTTINSPTRVVKMPQQPRKRNNRKKPAPSMDPTTTDIFIEQTTRSPSRKVVTNTRLMDKFNKKIAPYMSDE